MATSAGVFSAMFLAGVRLRSTRVVEVRRLRCHAEDQTQEVSTPTVLAKSNTAAPHPPPTPPPAPKVSTKFTDVLAFSGPAPERINGRLAMVGFVAALAVEITTGHNVIEQLSDGGLQWFLLASGVLMVASLVPLFRGVTVESVSDGFMSSKAELWNGRMAMLGLVALVFTEYLKGGPLI